MKAIIITGGKGKRMKDLTKNFPKHLLPVGKNSLLTSIIKQLEKVEQITTIEIIVGWCSDLIIQEIDRNYFSKNIKVLKDSNYSGSWWPYIYNRIRFLPKNEPLLIWVGDLFADYDITKSLIQAGKYKDKFVTLSFKSIYSGLCRGIFSSKFDGSTKYYPNRTTIPKDWVNVGIYIFPPKLLLDMDIIYPERYLFPILIKKRKLTVLKQEGYALNINTPVDLFEANMSLFKKKYHINHNIKNTFHISSKSCIHPSALIKNCVIVNNKSIIEKNTILSECIVISGSYVPAGVNINKAIIGPDVTYFINKGRAIKKVLKNDKKQKTTYFND